MNKNLRRPTEASQAARYLKGRAMHSPAALEIIKNNNSKKIIIKYIWFENKSFILQAVVNKGCTQRPS